jgi:hypothetical protein
MLSNVAIKPSEQCPGEGFGALNVAFDLASESYTRELCGPLAPFVLDKLDSPSTIRPLGLVSPAEKPLPARLRAAGEEIHLLVIELTDSNRAALEVDQSERRRWLAEASAAGASLMVLTSEDSLELYSTERDRVKAFRPVLRTLNACVRNVSGLGATRTLSKQGTAAARHLLRRSAGLDSTDLGRSHLVAGLHAAASQAAAAKALGRTLMRLVASAARVIQRVRKETEMGDLATAPELVELETLGIERITEEELAAWQAAEAERRRAEEQARARDLYPPMANPANAFQTQELISEVRIRFKD